MGESRALMAEGGLSSRGGLVKQSTNREGDTNCSSGSIVHLSLQGLRFPGSSALSSGILVQPLMPGIPLLLPKSRGSIHSS